MVREGSLRSSNPSHPKRPADRAIHIKNPHARVAAFICVAAQHSGASMKGFPQRDLSGSIPRCNGLNSRREAPREAESGFRPPSA